MPPTTPTTLKSKYLSTYTLYIIRNTKLPMLIQRLVVTEV